MVRQGDSDLMAYYDEVERKLTLVTNKIVMSHNTDTAAILNKEVRDDALHAFIAGLKRTLKTLVLPAQPKDLPSALALAREAEKSIERSAFAASYAKAIEEKSHFYEGNRRNNKGQGKQWRGEDKNPHFIPKQNQSFDSLTRAGVALDLGNSVIKYANVTEKLKFFDCQNVNFTKIDDIVVPSSAKADFKKIILKRIKAFLTSNEALTFNTSVIATIGTTSDEPVYSKLYPYPMGAADFVNNEIKELLQNGIIRPSRSPYNSPAWVVDKKGTDDNGSKKKRLVIDFKKLNERTIADRYPMPSIPMILANLGKAQFFTTLDLKSGYHQIYLAEKDREKTSFSVNGGKYEFCRLPFGLKNAGSIFQRAIDDVLREEIGKICYVYVDDVIIFSENETEHVKHIDKTIYCDNEASFNSETITPLLRNQYSIDVVNAPPLHSSSNGQVERFHSTLAEIARCLKIDRKIEDTVELILRLTIISIILLSTASARITDFSHAKYIPVLDGNVLVWEQYGLVRHSTNLSEFASIIDSTVRMLELFPHSHMRKLLEVDIEHAQNLLEELKVHHRMARSLDFLGSILKVVAGTPDADDLSRINTNQASLIEANNRQVIINTETQKHINLLTDTVNKILREKKDGLVDSGHLFETLLARNRMLISEIQNFQYPRVKRICKKVLLFPVAHYHTIQQIVDNIVAECDDGILAVSDCASTNLATFCKKASHDTCARQLHAGVAATCRTRPSNLERLTIVDDGVIIVNEKLTRISIDDGPTTTIVGTILITFERKAVINDSVYLNLNYSVNKSPGIAASPLINITGHDHILSLPMLQRMNEHNLRLMQELREDVSAGGSSRIWFAAGVAVSLTQQHCRRKR
ncbi:hypothetical protein KR074_008542 [Drosophila pseudoananassae]|nr:hypothetical protein KR074_008542 [Drosophila pseudoananassae]